MKIAKFNWFSRVLHKDTCFGQFSFLVFTSKGFKKVAVKKVSQIKIKLLETLGMKSNYFIKFTETNDLRM